MPPAYTIRDATYADAPALADVVIEPNIATFRGLVPDHCLDWLTSAVGVRGRCNRPRDRPKRGDFGGTPRGYPVPPNLPANADCVSRVIYCQDAKTPKK